MKKQATKNQRNNPVNNSGKLFPAKSKKYVYTEADLGENILYEGLNAAYPADKKIQLNSHYNNNYAAVYSFI